MRRIAVFGWPLAGVCVTLLDALIRHAAGLPITVEGAFWHSVGWLQWALLAPVVVALSERFPYRPRGRWRFALVHVLGALAISTTHSAIYYTLRTAWFGAPGAPGQPLRVVWIANLPLHLSLDLLVYGGTLFVTQLALLLQASRRRDEERLALERALAGAELDAFKLQLPAGVVTGRLREIERAIPVDVERAEQLLEEFSADLRQSLEIVGMHAAVDEIAQDEHELETELPPPLSRPMFVLLLFALVPTVQMFLDALLIGSAVARGRPIRWMLVAQHVSYASLAFPLTATMVWLGSRVQRVALLAVAAATLPVVWVGMVDIARGGWAAARAHLDVASRALDFLLFFAIALASLTWTRYKAWRAESAEIAELESRLLRTRAVILRLQLNPHFLFNALNSVAALLEDDPAGAATMLAELRRFVARVLEHSDRDEVPLREELELLSAYVAIENVRFDGRVELVVRANDRARDALVPSFLLQPLVENALRHGLEPERGGRIDVRATIDHDALRIEIDDDGRSDDAHPPSRQGVGLSNTRARLAQSYGDDFVFHTAAHPHGFTVAVGFPYRNPG